MRLPSASKAPGRATAFKKRRQPTIGENQEETHAMGTMYFDGDPQHDGLDHSARDVPARTKRDESSQLRSQLANLF
jgi:hypothetical protein